MLLTVSLLQRAEMITAASFSGILLLLIGVAYLVLGFESYLTIRVFAVGVGAMIAPFLASVVTGVLEAGQTLIGAFITE